MVGADNVNVGRHVVQFYGRDEELAERVTGYLLGALASAGVAIVIATPEHRNEFEARLAGRPTEPDRWHASAITTPGDLAAFTSDDLDEARTVAQIEQELRAQAAGQLRASGAAWEFERRQGIVVDELIAAATAIGEAHPDETLAIIVGT